MARMERRTRAAMARRLMVWRFMGLVGKTSGSGSENQIQNPQAFVFVAFDSLIVAEYGDSVGERVPINVGETGENESD